MKPARILKKTGHALLKNRTDVHLLMTIFEAQSDSRAPHTSHQGAKSEKHCKTTHCRETVLSRCFGDFLSPFNVVPPCTTLNFPIFIHIFSLFLSISCKLMVTVITDAPHMVQRGAR